MNVSINRQVVGILAGLTLVGSLAACGTKSLPLATSNTKAGGSTTTSVASTKADVTTTTDAKATTSTTDAATNTTTAGESGGGPTDHSGDDIQTFPKVDWDSSASDYRDRTGIQVRYACPKDGTLGTVWGSNPYTDDSSVCTAAVHAGLIKLAEGGTVLIKVTGPKDSFKGSTSNGVTTDDYGSWGGSFIFLDKPGN